MNIIGRAQDGSIVGEDDDGNLVRGAETPVPYTETERVVTSYTDDDGAARWTVEYSIRGELIGKGDLDHDPDRYPDADDGGAYTFVAEPRFETAIVDGVRQRVEQTATIIEWES